MDVNPSPAGFGHSRRRIAIELLLVVGGLTALVLAGLLPAGGVLQDPAKPGFIDSYLLKGLVFFIFLFGITTSLAYGIAAGTVS